MKTFSLLAGVLAGALALAAQTGPVNLNFEQGQPGDAPPGWLSPVQGAKPELVAEAVKSGRMCAMVRPATPFGNLMQTFDAAPYRGKRVRFRAEVRTEPGSRAQMWLRVDRKGRRMGAFDNMQDRPIRSVAWSANEIVADVDDDAETVNIGFMVFGYASGYIDDVSFEVTGTVERGPMEPARPLTERGMRNLVAFARLFGWVRYFHPGDEAARADWDRLSIEGVRKVEGAASDKELAARLADIFRSVAPTVSVASSGKPGSLPAPSGALKIVSWRHVGLGQRGTMNVYTSERVTRSAGETAAIKPMVLRESGIVAAVPRELFADDGGTLPHTSPPAASLAVVRYSANDRATRIAGVILAWNVFEHFYPYFDVTPVDWIEVLRQSMSAAASDKDEDAFLPTLQRMVAALKDGHGNVNFQMMLMPAPLVWDWVEGRLTITHVPDPDTGLARGDVVLTIDGKPVEKAFAEAAELISGATPQWIRYKATNELRLLAPQSDGLRLEVEPANAPGTRKLALVKRPASYPRVDEPRPDKVAELEPGIFYFDPGRATAEDWKAALPKLEKARGIVFEFRGYPRQHVFLQYLTSETLRSAQWHTPVVLRPDREGMEFQRGGEWVLPPLAKLPAKCAFLTDGRAISYAESVMGIVEHYKLGEIVGGPTAGTNGNVNPIKLPGGYSISWTGMKVLKHDGSRHHGVGIQPTVPVSRTRAGVIAGRDEVLERAVELVKR